MLNHSTNAPTDLPQPARVAGDTRTHTRVRGPLRESFHFTELNDCVLAGRSLTPHLAAMRRLNVGSAQTLYVGDMVVDIQTARAAGVPVWVVTTGSETPEALDQAAPDRRLESLAEILILL